MLFISIFPADTQDWIATLPCLYFTPGEKMNSKSVTLPLHYRTHLTSESHVHKDMSVSVYTGTYICDYLHASPFFFPLCHFIFCADTHIHKTSFFIINKAIKFYLQSPKYFQNLVSQII